MRVPFIDLKAQFQSIRKEVHKAIRRVLDSQQFILGKEGKRLEEALQKYLGVRYVVGVASGTDALTLSLIASGVKANTEVLTTPYTFAATASSILRAGGYPRFIDIDPTTYNLNVSLVEEFLSSLRSRKGEWVNPKTGRPVVGILPVHLFGCPCEMTHLTSLARKFSLTLIEDCAQAVGAEWNGKKVGSFGDFSALSFYPTKNLGGFGDAGAIATPSKEASSILRLLRNHGDAGKYDHQMVGFNSRLDEIQACVLSVKLQHLDLWNRKRRERAERYIRWIQSEGLGESATTPENVPGHIYHQFVIRVKHRDRVKEKMAKMGVETAVHYPKPLHLQKAFEFLGYKKGDFPESELLAEEALALPIYPELTPPQQEWVVQALKKAVRQK